MRTNLQRRHALLDAAIEVLARDGARGLTFRAVDREASVPGGTASNYFANRDELLTQVVDRFYERLQPDEAIMAELGHGPRTRETITRLLTETVDRVATFRSGFLALLELRLEATRRPRLQAVLTERVRADLSFNVRNHLDSGLPGDETSVRLLYLALNWLILERLTLPELFTDTHNHQLIAAAVDRTIG
ncbi:TetR/AcrR family transcriptional regulator [Phytoactinopolyspora halotolerans]|uniref:TetR family transcriptional regulator n=1 Tax=Phytoactinopolyspora halotolerans TaxID=1981512 RepID=A0A6L9SFK0_9ACTN|nr:TetR/AcrR family transcriptional regulator [Phytoactinopolyspora halotolerans]NEE03398.1 TetR family transcriptional regulator [Phytoactinopolyspora halotolerans]